MNANHKTGSVFAARLLSSMDKVRITDADFAQSMHNFVNQCIVLPAMIGNRYTLEELRNDKDIWGLVKSNAPKLLRFSYLDARNRHAPPELLSCREGAIKLESDLRGQIAKVTNRLAKVNLPDFIASMAASGGNNRSAINAQAKGLLEGYLTNTFSELKTVSNNAEDILKQQMMINAIIDGSSNKLAQIGGSSNYATAKAMLQQKNTYGIMGALVKGLPMVKTVFEALVYGAFVFIIFLALLPGGHKILFGYFQTIAWLQLWAPLNAILNLIITVTAKSRTLDMIGDSGGMTLANSAGVIQLNEDMCSYAMYLSMLIPFIAIAVVKGMSSFVQLASHIGSGYQAVASSTAGEVTSGNISLGNISQRMRSMEGMQMFQNNMSPSFHSGQHREMLEDGAERISNLDGSTVYRSGAGNTSSILSTNLRASDALSSQLTENINQEKSAMEGRNKELSTQESIAEKRTADFIERATIAQNSGTSYDVGQSTTAGRTMQNAVDLTNSLRDELGITTRQAAQITAAASVSGTAEMDNKGSGAQTTLGVALKASLGAEYRTDAQRNQTVSAIQDHLEKKGYSENLDTISRATKDIRFGGSQSEDKSLSESLSSSYTKMQSLRESNSISEQNIDRYSKGVAYVESKGFSMDRDLGQPFLEYLSTRQEHGREIGMETARKMISMWGSDAQVYFKYFTRDQQDSILEKANSPITESRAKIDSTFDNTSVGSIDTKGAFEKVYNHAQDKGVTPNVVQNKDLKNEVESKLENANSKIDARQVENVQGMKKQQSKADAKYEKNLLASAMGNIGNSNRGKEKV